MLDRRPVLAGVLFGLLTIKPQLGLLLPVDARADRTLARRSRPRAATRVRAGRR